MGKFVGFPKSKLVALPSALPVSKPMVVVGGNGRIGFSSKLTSVFSGCKWAWFDYDSEGKRIKVTGLSELPTGANEGDYFSFAAAKGKGKTVSIGAAGFLFTIPYEGTREKKDPSGNPVKDARGRVETLPNGYDYKKAGNQHYEPEAQDPAEHTVIFALPKSLPAALPIQKRAPRKSKTAPPADTGVNVATENAVAA